VPSPVQLGLGHVGWVFDKVLRVKCYDVGLVLQPWVFRGWIKFTKPI
jgi:hypothetical protein